MIPDNEFAEALGHYYEVRFVRVPDGVLCRLFPDDYSGNYFGEGASVIGLGATPREAFVAAEAVLDDPTQFYDREFEQQRPCARPGCGHAYVRHFHSDHQMDATGCKYCGCDRFLLETP